MHLNEDFDRFAKPVPEEASASAKRVQKIVDDDAKFFFNSAAPDPAANTEESNSEREELPPSPSGRKRRESIRKEQNQKVDRLWEEQLEQSKQKDKEIQTKKDAAKLFRQLHAMGESRFAKSQDEMRQLYHVYDGDTSIDFEHFYQCLKDHYFTDQISIQNAKKIFAVVDRDGTGSIDFTELHHVYDEAVRSLGRAEVAKDEDMRLNQERYSSLEMTRTQKALNQLTNDEMVLRKEALKRMNELKYKIQEKLRPRIKTSLEETLRKTYALADVNGDGNLSYEEFSDWLGEGPGGLQVGFTKDEVRDITLATDVDLDGGISIDEFIEFVTRKNKQDPRTFMNESRAARVGYMRSLRNKSLKNMRKKVERGDSARTVDTDHSTHEDLSTRLWDDEDEHGRVIKPSSPTLHTMVDSGRSSSKPEFKKRMASTVNDQMEQHLDERSMHRTRFYALDEAKTIHVRGQTPPNSSGSHLGPLIKSPVRRNLRKSFSSPTLSARSSILRRNQAKRRQPTVKYQTSVNLDMAPQHYLPGGSKNVALSTLDFEDMAKSTFTGRWDGRGKAFKPDWASRLTFDRVGVGGASKEEDSSPDKQSIPGFLAETSRRAALSRKAAHTMNPAGKYIDDWTRQRVVDHDERFVRTRNYLRANKRAIRTNVKRLDHEKHKAEHARILGKSGQQLRYLEVLEAIEERHINSTFFTKGLIKSPQAARMKAGSFTLFRPPSAGGSRSNDNLQTGIGTRKEAIVNWSY